MTTAAPAAFPDAALREVLARLAAEWARASARRARVSGEDEGPDEGSEGGEAEEARPERRRRVYVDAFAGAEFAFGAGVGREPGEETRAAAVARALAEGPRAAMVFLDEDPAHLARLDRELEPLAQAGRVRRAHQIADVAPGDILLVEADFREAAEDVLRLADGADVLLWAAPAVARGLPWDVLAPFVGRDGVDVLFRVPAADFEKQARHTTPVADLPAFVKRIVEGCSALLGDPKHAWLAAWRADQREGGPERAMEGALGRFRARFEGAAGDRIVKPASLVAGGAAAHLFLVTADPALALAMNGAVRGAGLTNATPPAEEFAAPPEPEAGREEAAVLDLFPEDLPPPEPPRPQVDPAAVAEAVAARFAGRKVEWREVLLAFTATDLAPDDLRKALAHLKRAGRARYAVLRDEDAAIDFPATPIPPSPKRKKRKAAADEVGLFGPEADDEED